MNQTDKQNVAPIVLFDGVCNLCNAAIQFILKHEIEETIRFGTLQNPENTKLLTPFKNAKIYDSVLFIEDGKLYQESDAALKIARFLKFYRHFYFMIYLPRWFRNPVYRFIARNRYKWFGKREQCMTPDKEVKHRFL